MRTTMSMRQPRRRHGRTNDRRPKIPGKSCCGPGRLLLNSLDSGFWLQLDLARVRPETSFKPVADRTWPKSLCDQNKDASGFSLKRSGPQQDPDTAGGVHPHLQVADGTGPVGRAPDQPPRQISRAASYHGSNQIPGQRDPGSEKEENPPTPWGHRRVLLLSFHLSLFSQLTFPPSNSFLVGPGNS